MNKQFLVDADFIKIGEYSLQNNDMIITKITKEKLNEREKACLRFCS